MLKDFDSTKMPADFKPVRDIFLGYDEILEKFDKILKAEQTKKIIIATHMHAGDGNVHVNIPVHSGDYEMMLDADETAARVIKKTTEFGGVISGEHGIGLTKLKFIGQDVLDHYAAYKKEYDPEDLFNPGKLTSDFAYNTIYTPSLNLLNKEALIFEAADLTDLTSSISACVRCGKCKPNCNTQYPVNNMHYSPRNKILGTSLISEAILYEAQTSRGLTLRNFTMLKEIANHCTMCHNCFAPCPVNIDFGEVTLAIRNLLYDRKRARLKPLTRMTLFYLRRRGYYTNKIFRYGLLRFGYFAQRSARILAAPFKPLTRKTLPTVTHLLDGRFPKDAGHKTFREIFGLQPGDTFYSFTNPDKEVAASVMYFPGCGSERMFSQISLAALAVLYNSGIRIIVPPDFMCCGYPLVANGQESQAKTRVYENSVIFHRMAETASYMNIKNVLVTCGTCYEMLGKYSLENIFTGARLLDVNEFLVQENLPALNKPELQNSTPVLYHEPCHSPLKQYGSEIAIKTLLSSNITVVPNCCGEGGTMALSTPDISTLLRNRKTTNIKKASSQTNLKKLQVVTTCPSCVQGLSKIDGKISVTGRSLITLVAEQHFGKKWKQNFIRHVKQNKSIENILF
jgi:Fe-S oxidoreductase